MQIKNNVLNTFLNSARYIYFCCLKESRKKRYPVANFGESGYRLEIRPRGQS